MIRSQEFNATPEKRQKPDTTTKTRITSTTPPTIPPNYSPDINTYKPFSKIREVQIQVTNKKPTYIPQPLYNHSNEGCPFTKKMRMIYNYLTQNEYFNRQDILNIIQQNTQIYPERAQTEQALLDELSNRIKRLLDENQQLRANRSQPNQDLIIENRKYKLMLEEYKQMEINHSDKLLAENHRLNNRINQLQLQITLLRRIEVSSRPMESSSKIQQQKDQLNRQLQLFYADLQNKTKLMNNTVNNFDQRLNIAEQRIDRINLQRKFDNRQSSIRKSKNYAELSPKIMGDVDNVYSDDIEIQYGSKPIIIQSNIAYSGISQDQSNSRLRMLEEINRTLERQYRKLSESIEFLKRQLNYQIDITNQKLKTSQMNNENLSAYNAQLAAQLKNNRLLINQQIEKILILENQLNKYNKSKTQKQLYKDVKEIRQSLQSCEPPTLQAERQLDMLIRQTNTHESKQIQLVAFKERSVNLQNQLIGKQSKIRQLEIQIYRYQKQNQMLKRSLTNLQSQMQKLKLKWVEQEKIVIKSSKSQRGQGLVEWQKMLKSKVKDASSRLYKIEEQMYKDSN